MLVVDDERLNRMVIARSLETQFDVVEAGDGTEALERVATGGVDLVVIDIHMPDMDGYELTQQIKWMNPGMFLPVVLMTANNNEELFARGLTDGADDFLAKPIAPSLLEAKIKALLRVVEILHEQRERNEELNRWRARAEQDFGVAQKLFEHIAERGRFDFPWISTSVRCRWRRSTATHRCWRRRWARVRLRLLVGDFAGHGLGAALGAMPVSDVFYAMTRRRFPIEAVVREIGGKLYRMFPRHQFLAAARSLRHRHRRGKGAGLERVALRVGRSLDAEWAHRRARDLAAPGAGRAVGARPLFLRSPRCPLPLGGRLVMYTTTVIEARCPAASRSATSGSSA